MKKAPLEKKRSRNSSLVYSGKAENFHKYPALVRSGEERKKFLRNGNKDN